MKKFIIPVVVVVGLLIAGVLVFGPSSNGEVPIIPPINGNPTNGEPAEPVYPDNPPMDQTWISPGKVVVGNFYPGARAEWTLLVHNGNEWREDQVWITLDPGDTAVPITLQAPLYGASHEVGIESSNLNDELVVTSYDTSTNQVVIEGFASETAKRTVTLRYRYYATFAVDYRLPDRVEEDYTEATEEQRAWVIITDPTPVIGPRETKEILIAVVMPEDAVAPGPEWEFWISVKDTTQAGMVVTELCSRWLVAMRV